MVRRTIQVMRRAVDVCLVLVFVLLMATALVEDFAHEWLGIAAFVLVAAHQVLNRAWWRALPRGRYTVRRAAGTVVDLGLVGCTLALLASSVVISTHAFGWLPAISGASWARTAHLAGSYWAYLCAALHVGFHVQPALARVWRCGGVRRTILLAACAACALAGGWCAVTLDMWTYLTLSVPFVFVDAAVSRVGRLVQWVLAGAFFSLAGAVIWQLLGAAPCCGARLRGGDGGDGHGRRRRFRSRPSNHPCVKRVRERGETV